MLSVPSPWLTFAVKILSPDGIGLGLGLGIGVGVAVGLGVGVGDTVGVGVGVGVGLGFLPCSFDAKAPMLRINTKIKTKIVFIRIHLSRYIYVIENAKKV
jgi:hypothetical protein